MADAMQGISEDVPFDEAAADDLATKCDAAATAIEGQQGSRAAWVSTALNDFKGHFSVLFSTNANTAKGDARELVTALRDTATGARKLKADAKAEQARRVKAREWKYHHDHRSGLEKLGDSIFGGDDCPIPDPSPTLSYQPSQPAPKPRENPAPGSGGSGGGTSSARPADLRTFAKHSATANHTLRTNLQTTRAAYHHFVATCHWGSLSADGVFTGFHTWLDENDNDVKWANTVAAAFAKAGGDGNVSTLANSAIHAALQAAGVTETREDLTIQMPSALGHPPTTGYANDPVNTATGNFVETEIDLEFLDAASELGWQRSYNSVSGASGAFGTGWTSWAEAGLSYDDEAAHFTLPDGRQLTFPRLGDGWDRAVGESLWLQRTDTGLQVRDNQGTRWALSAAGRLLSVDHGPGTGVRLDWAPAADGDRLVRLTHERGRWVALTWDDAAGRITAVEASDGRRVDYAYDGAGRLVSASGPLGTRSYRWNEAGLIAAVVDADGVVEVENDYDEFGRVTRQRSPHGRTTRFVYLPGRITVVSDEDGLRSNTWIADSAGRLVGVVDADEHRASFAYDSHGCPVIATERDGATTITEYDDRGRKVRQVLPSGADLTFAYDEADRVVRVEVLSAEPLTDPDTANMSVTTYEYAGSERNPCLVVDPEGGRTELTWESGLLRRLVDPTGVVVRFDYDEHGDLVATTDAVGNVARLERDETGRVTAAVTPSGARTAFAYHPDSGLLASRTDPDGATWTYEYTAAGRMTAVVDPAGGRTTVEHDAAGEEARTIDPLGRAVSRRYDDLGNLASVTLPDGSQWRFSHDALSRVREITDPAGGTVTTEYDAVGAPTRVVDPTGTTTEIGSDSSALRTTVSDGVSTVGAEVDRLGRLVSETRPDGSTVLTRYDRCGRPVEVVDPAGGLTRVERDAGGRVTTLVRPTGAEVAYAYDACGRLVSITDPTGGTTRYVYDADGRVAQQIAPTGEAATFRYDECGRLVHQRVPGVGTSTYAYDACSRLVESRDPVNGQRRFGYDAAGQLVEAIDGNGGTTRYAYDANGRCVEITHPDGGLTRREYDAGNRCTAQTDPLGRTTRAGYDAAGRQTWQSDPTGRRTEWRYDERTGLLESMLVDGVEVSRIERDLPGRRVRIFDRSNPSGALTVHELAWDSRGLLTSRTRDGRGLAWTYDADGRCTGLTTPDGHTTRYAHDAAGRLLGVEHPLLGRVVVERDAAGRPVSAQAGDQTQSWTYSHGFVATHEQHGPRGGTRSRIERDESGRIAAVHQEDQDGSVRTSYTYDDACQLLAASTGEETVRWRYDACGRLVGETLDGTAHHHVTRLFDYDAAGQLQRVTLGGEEIATYAYDAAGRRTSETRPGGRRDYHWAPAGWLAALVETDRLGDTTRTDVVVDALGELAYVGGVEFFSDTARPWAGMVSAGEETVVRGGPFTGTTDGGWASPGWREARAVSADPWAVPGRVSSAAGFEVTPTGDLLLGGGGFGALEWLTNRVYDPATRAFCSVDPIEATTGAGWAANPYSYAGNDPLHALDPLGLHPVTDAELRAYNANNGGLIAGAGHWLKNNWEYVAGAAMVIGGGALMFVPGGQAFGMGLMSAGADTIIQKATTGHVNWGEVAVSGVLGMVTGPGAGLAEKAGLAGWKAAAAAGAIDGAWQGGAASGAGYFMGPGPHTVTGFLETTGTGTLTGAGGGAVLGSAAHGIKSHLEPKLSDIAPTPPSPSKELVPYYPPNRGALGDWHDGYLMAGDRIDRYGYPGGTYVSPEGVPYEARALPPGSDAKPYHVYEVVKPIPVKSSTVAPAFGELGLGQQHELPMSVEKLMRHGILKEVK